MIHALVATADENLARGDNPAAIEGYRAALKIFNEMHPLPNFAKVRIIVRLNLAIARGGNPEEAVSELAWAKSYFTDYRSAEDAENAAAALEEARRLAATAKDT